MLITIVQTLLVGRVDWKLKVCDLLQSTLTYLLLQPVTRKNDEGMEEEDEGAEEEAELMQNKEFLQSVLSTLPGVNPEEALQNLEEMTQEEEEKEEEDKVSGKSCFFFFSMLTCDSGLHTELWEAPQPSCTHIPATREHEAWQWETF